MQHTIDTTATMNGLKLLWLLSVLMAFFYNIQGFPLFDLDEGAFGQATREMFHRDNFLTIYLNGEPRYDKPILTYWLQALSISTFGVSEFAFRLPSAIAATLWNLLIVAFTWRLTSPRVALISGTLMAGALGTGLIGKAATADALLNLFLSGTLFSLYLGLVTTKTRYLISAALFAGLGFLTKGPIALMIPAVVSLLFALWSGRWQQWLQIIINPWAWFIFLSVGLPWYIVSYLKEGAGFIDGFIGIHNFGRFNQAMEGHSGPWWYYLPTIFLVAFPFGMTILQPFTRIKELYSSDLNRFLITWFLFVLIFFSFSATKLPHYLLYGLTPLFILAAQHLDDRVDLKAVYIPLILLLLWMLSLPHLINLLVPYIEDAALAEALLQPANYLPENYRLTLVLTLAACLWLLMNPRWSRQGRLLSAGIISTFIVSELLLPIVGRIQQEPIREAGLIAARHQGPTVMWRLNNPSFSIYCGRVTPRRTPTKGDLVLTKARHLNQLPPYRKLYQRQGIALALIDNEKTNHVPAHSTPIESASYLDTTPTGSPRRSAALPVTTQQFAVSTDQLTITEPNRPISVADVHDSGRRAGRARPAATSLQTPSQSRRDGTFIRHHRSYLGTPPERDVRIAETCSGIGCWFDGSTRPYTQTEQFSLGPCSHPLQPSRLHGSLVEGSLSANTFPYPVGTWPPGGPFPQCGRRSLATGHFCRSDHWLELRYAGEPLQSAYFTDTRGYLMAGPIPYGMYRLSPASPPYRIQHRPTHTAWNRSVCPGPGVSATHECAALRQDGDSGTRELNQ
jgi:hypothetical protein